MLKSLGLGTCQSRGALSLGRCHLMENSGVSLIFPEAEAEKRGLEPTIQRGWAVDKNLDQVEVTRGVQGRWCGDHSSPS